MLGILNIIKKGVFLINPITSRQLQILKFIRDFFLEHSFPPSLREIGLSFKIAPSSVLDHLKTLEKKGFIRRTPFKGRCIEILKKIPECHES